MVRSQAGLWGSQMNNYQIIITIILFLEASGTVPGSPYKFSEWNRRNRTLWRFIHPHTFPANQDLAAI